MKVIGITGGTGSGKSSLAIRLVESFGNKACYLSMDDYFKRSSNIEKDESGTVNWDSPQALDFDRFYEDIVALMSGRKIRIMSKSKYYNPNFEFKVYEKKEVEISPNEILVLEGFMLFFDERIRSLIDTKIYLDLPINIALQRRDTDKHKPDQEYVAKYLLPNQLNNVEPTKKFADLIINTQDKNLDETVKICLDFINR